MPIYEFKCACGETVEKFQKNYRKRLVKCVCGKGMVKVFSQVNTDLVNNERWSNAMGVNPRQIPEAMKLYPGSVYNEKGRLRVSNRKEKLLRMAERGVHEYD